jgi:hypothetical protein
MGQVLERVKERRASIEWGEPLLRKEVMLKRPAFGFGVEAVRVVLVRVMRRIVATDMLVTMVRGWSVYVRETLYCSYVGADGSYVT